MDGYLDLDFVNCMLKLCWSFAYLRTTFTGLGEEVLVIRLKYIWLAEHKGPLEGSCIPAHGHINFGCSHKLSIYLFIFYGHICHIM